MKSDLCRGLDTTNIILGFFAIDVVISIADDIPKTRSDS